MGDTLKAVNGNTVILQSVARKDTLATVYNFTVADNLNYFVGEPGVLVHNSCAMDLLELKKYAKLKDAIQNLDDDLKGAIMVDLKNADAKLFDALNADGGLEAWKMLTNKPALRTNPEAISTVASLSVKKSGDKLLDVEKLLKNGFGEMLEKSTDAHRTTILRSIKQWEGKAVEELAVRLGKDSYPDLAADLMKPELFDLYEKLIRNPYFCDDFLDELIAANPNIKHLQKSEFWKAIRKQADDFEEGNSELIRQGADAPCGSWGGNANRTPHSQLYILGKGGKMVILDDAIVDNMPLEEVTKDGKRIYRLIYHDSKLSKDAPWTPNQRSEIIDIFKNDASKPYLEFEVRNGGQYFGDETTLRNGTIVRIYRGDIYKSYREETSIITVKVFK